MRSNKATLVLHATGWDEAAVQCLATPAAIQLIGSIHDRSDHFVDKRIGSTSKPTRVPRHLDLGTWKGFTPSRYNEHVSGLIMDLFITFEIVDDGFLPGQICSAFRYANACCSLMIIERRFAWVFRMMGRNTPHHDTLHFSISGQLAPLKQAHEQRYEFKDDLDVPGGGCGGDTKSGRPAI